MTADNPSHFSVLGLQVNLTTISEVIKNINMWIEERDQFRYIVATGMHGVVEAQRRPCFRTVIAQAALFVPDGFSLVFIARLRGLKIRNRVSGPDLMLEACKNAEIKGHKVFFYGDTEETLKELRFRLSHRFPNLKIVGIHSPPFRPLSEMEVEEELSIINSSEADILWVALGLPKQEQWLYERRDRLTVPVGIGVGAAFKFISGHSKRAPSWIGENGFEWLWRLVFEPRRVWKRILIDGPYFVFCIIKEALDSKSINNPK